MGKRAAAAKSPGREWPVWREARRVPTLPTSGRETGAAAATAAVMAAARPSTGVNKTKLPRPLVEWSVGKAR